MIEHAERYTISCFIDKLLRGDEILWAEKVWNTDWNTTKKGNKRVPRPVGTRRVAAKVCHIGLGYTENCKLTLEILDSDGHEHLKKGKMIQRQWGTLYGGGVRRKHQNFVAF